jgi:hypothetical protein
MVERLLFRDIPELHLTISNYGGSVEHFHHFLLGFLVPLVCIRKTTWLNPAYSKVLIRSCGPMDAIIRQFMSGRLKILDKLEHRGLGDKRSRLGTLLRGVAVGTGDLRHMDVRGYDYPVVYSFRAFANAQAGLRELLGGKIDAACVSLGQKFTSGSPRILVVERGEADPFYLSKTAEAKYAGSVRRSIPNHSRMVDEVSRRIGPLLSMKLEDLPLAEQIALFSSVDVVVAQHGAALSNLIWAQPGSCVVEIMPKTMPKEILDVGFFSNLARCMRLHHCFVWQDHDHAEVGPSAVCEAIERMFASRQLRKLSTSGSQERIGEQRAV